MSDTPVVKESVTTQPKLIERLRMHLSCYWKEGDVAPQLTSIELMLIEEAANELAAAQAQRDKAMREADAMEEFLSAAAKQEKEASAIIESLAANIHITVPLRDYTEMSPKDCYELGMMDGVAALKSQINAAIEAKLKEKNT